MAIDLNGINVTKLNQQSGRAERSEDRRAEARRSEDAARQERVEISRDAKSVEQATRVAQEADAFDEARVKEISQAIADGSYPVNRERIAEKFLELESQLY